MNVQTKPSLGAAQRLLPFERVALVLQGGGSLVIMANLNENMMAHGEMMNLQMQR
jgi:cytochrome o ubiquinol oxidase subunit IV